MISAKGRDSLDGYARCTASLGYEKGALIIPLGRIRPQQHVLSGFVFEEEICVDGQITLKDRRDIAALYQMTPYAWKTPREAAERLLNLPELTTEFSFQIHQYRKQPQ